jgi:hypothetical protein
MYEEGSEEYGEGGDEEGVLDEDLLLESFKAVEFNNNINNNNNTSNNNNNSNAQKQKVETTLETCSQRECEEGEGYESAGRVYYSSESAVQDSITASPLYVLMSINNGKAIDMDAIHKGTEKEKKKKEKRVLKKKVNPKEAVKDFKVEKKRIGGNAEELSVRKDDLKKQVNNISPTIEPSALGGRGGVNGAAQEDKAQSQPPTPNRTPINVFLSFYFIFFFLFFFFLINIFALRLVVL